MCFCFWSANWNSKIDMQMQKLADTAVYVSNHYRDNVYHGIIEYDFFQRWNLQFPNLGYIMAIRIQ